jgi:hypothetical protein
VLNGTASSNNNNNNNNNKQQLTREQLVTVATWLYEASLEHLEHGEARVRTFVAKAVGAHAVRTLNETDNATAQTQRLSILVNLVKSIDKHLTRDEMKVVVVVLLLLILTRVTRTRTIHIPRVPKGPSMIQRVGTLETNWQCLAFSVASLGGSFWTCLEPTTDTGGVPDLVVTQLLPHLEYSCNTHVNRHVRAAGIAVLEQMVHTAAATGTQYGAASYLLINPTSPLRKTIIQVLKVGLADNWSQVRMAASVLNRIFSMALRQLKVEDSNIKLLYPTLVPRMCLNHFYLAQGVKLYSHQTWKCVFASDGGDVVALTRLLDLWFVIMSKCAMPIIISYGKPLVKPLPNSPSNWACPLSNPIGKRYNLMFLFCCKHYECVFMTNHGPSEMKHVWLLGLFVGRIHKNAKPIWKPCGPDGRNN